MFPAFLTMNMSPTLVWVNLERVMVRQMAKKMARMVAKMVARMVGGLQHLVGSILESTQVTNTAVGTGLSLTLLNCSTMFLCSFIRYFMIPSSSLVMPRPGLVISAAVSPSQQSAEHSEDEVKGGKAELGVLERQEGLQDLGFTIHQREISGSLVTEDNTEDRRPGTGCLSQAEDRLPLAG